MKINGEKVLVHRNSETMFNYLQTPANFKELMPENVTKFEANETNFTFALKGMPEVALTLKESTPNSQVIYTSAKPSLNFDLEINIEENDDKAKVDLQFEGKFNPFIKMMVEKPLNKFIETLTANLATLS